MVKRKSGQAMVEYLLLLAVIVGGMVLFKQLLLAPQGSVVGMILGGVQCQMDVENGACGGSSRYPQAQRGGRQTFGEYYALKKASVTVK